jgi:protocatechuate 3,4-dioxygenase alpha subunit
LTDLPGLTPSQTVGPYLDIGMPWDDGPVAAEDGVRISGVVLDGEGAPIPSWRVPASRRDTLLAERTDDGYRFDIRIQGPGETVFFDV